MCEKCADERRIINRNLMEEVMENATRQKLAAIAREKAQKPFHGKMQNGLLTEKILTL